MRPRAFILEPQEKLDLRPAKLWGDIVYIFAEYDSRPSIWHQKLIDDAIGILQQYDYDPDKDYLIVAGAMVPLVMFVSAVCEVWRCPKVLYWDMRHRCYVERRLGRQTYIAEQIA
jgi:hypothetical protein